MAEFRLNTTIDREEGLLDGGPFEGPAGKALWDLTDLFEQIGMAPYARVLGQDPRAVAARLAAYAGLTLEDLEGTQP